MPGNKQCVAMLLAGGQGTRLGVLTKEVAKPAVPFGGKYRIIDFTLSNTINSDIDTIGVLTQYQPFELNQYIGNGQPWDFDRLEGGAFVLPPYQTAKSGEWYKGTANAIYQNINFLDRYSPQYVLILSGDHIYKMNYSKMLKEHISKGADCTIAVLNVPLEEASRFGIMNADKDGRITEFEEKPKKPKSTKASMGIYIFTWAKLKEYLIKDEEDKTSFNDFGKNIIPNMLNDGQKMYTYDFSGYWKDVGTISSLWEANMDLLKPESGLNLYDRSWIIYARNAAEPPHYAGPDSHLFNSVVSEGGEINGEIYNSVISTGVVIEKGAKIFDSVIMPNSIIRAGTEVRHSIIGWGAEILENCKIGEHQLSATAGEWKIAVVGPRTQVSKGTIVAAGEMVGK
ncbi:MAG: Glucose-1-phosphate adenylyltransferase [Firmicutes bacterium ADurb.Bin080]|jgi:glucose-1-phosphate adenylyltransferase|nr:glucose-1-phosphate adenylyltransferase [Clostridiales bacterium]OQC16819.1 MAG: Glucose-1-phosphate adenylyltransferase [Firmicutes bacterium ADurb.Bin080]